MGTPPTGPGLTSRQLALALQPTKHPTKLKNVYGPQSVYLSNCLSMDAEKHIHIDTQIIRILQCTLPVGKCFIIYMECMILLSCYITYVYSRVLIHRFLQCYIKSFNTVWFIVTLKWLQLSWNFNKILRQEDLFISPVAETVQYGSERCRLF